MLSGLGVFPLGSFLRLLSKTSLEKFRDIVESLGTFFSNDKCLVHAMKILDSTLRYFKVINGVISYRCLSIEETLLHV